jgi:hypothetical protein
MQRKLAFVFLIVLIGAGSIEAQGADCLWPAPPEFLSNRLSAPDSTLVPMGSELVKVCYSRPSARGREIFGGLVRYGAVWRTGADEPTMLHLSAAAEVAGVELAAGTYYLLTIPREDEWTILFNTSDASETAQIFDSMTEVGRGLVPVERLDEMIEMFTIRGTGTAAEAELVLDWERTRVRIPIRLLR